MSEGEKDIDSFTGNFEIDEELMENYRKLDNQLEAISSKMKRKSNLKLVKDK